MSDESEKSEKSDNVIKWLGLSFGLAAFIGFVFLTVWLLDENNKDKDSYRWEVVDPTTGKQGKDEICQDVNLCEQTVPIHNICLNSLNDQVDDSFCADLEPEYPTEITCPACPPDQEGEWVPVGQPTPCLAEDETPVTCGYGAQFQQHECRGGSFCDDTKNPSTEPISCHVTDGCEYTVRNFQMAE